jgi:acyl-CoA carboxylase epsilon subunit
VSERPVLRVVSGSPTPEELAVLAAVVATAGAAEPARVERVRRGGWNDPAALHRRMLIPGPNAWRASARH